MHIRGIVFHLPKEVTGKEVSVVEVGPFIEDGLRDELNTFFETKIEKLVRTNSYVLVHPHGMMNLESLLTGLPFVDPVMHRASLIRPYRLEMMERKFASLFKKDVLIGPLIKNLGIPFDYVLQSMLRRGTSDAEGNVALYEALLALGSKPVEGDHGFYSKQYFLKGNLNPHQLEEVSQFLANPNLNTRLILPRRQYSKGVKVFAPIVTLPPEIKVEEYDVANMTDAELLALSKQRKLAANTGEMKHFAAQYRDEKFLEERKKRGLGSKATDVELETWFGLRSEHCFHKEFNARITLEDRVNDEVFRRAHERGWLTKDEKGNYLLEEGIYKKFIVEPAKIIFDKLEKRGKNWIASMFDDNAGAVFYDEDFMFCIKWETHNSPSNKEPVQGAKTGIDGVNRDIFGMGLGTFDAIANFFYYCTGNPHYKGFLPQGVKHPYVILKGVTQGVREGGNESQIATFNGGLSTDPRYIAKCLVYCGTVGWSPARLADGRSVLDKNPGVGDLIYVAGQAVGVDGVHGATESSMSASALISLGHVQADFSLIQAKAKPMLVEVARSGLLTGITDCGAMGIGAANELARSTGGLELHLDKHPKKYAGIQPWQIECSETQNRMILAAKPEQKDSIMEASRKHDVEVTQLGHLTDSGYIDLKYEGKTVALLDMNRLFDKEPRKQMTATWTGVEDKQVHIKGKYTLQKSLELVLAQPDVACKDWFFRQKDSSVKAGTIIGPLQGLRQEVESDTTVQKPLDTEGRDYGAIAYACGIAPKLSDIDPYRASQKALVDMIGKIIAVGGALPDMENAKWDAWAVCGNFCQPNSDGNETLSRESGEFNLASLLREAIGVREIEDTLNVPVISGKDSMKCSCIYDLDLDQFMANSSSELAKAYMKLDKKGREDLNKAKEKLGDLYDSNAIDKIILSSLPADLSRHIIIAERDAKRKDDAGKEYTILIKAIEIHDPDSYLASCAVKIEDYRKCVTSAFKKTGDLIYVIGTTKNHLGASQYLSGIGYNEQGAPIEGGKAAEVDLAEFAKVGDAVHNAIDSRVVASCSYIHDGGLLTALTKAGFASEEYVRREEQNAEKRSLAGNNRLAFEILTKYIPQDGSCSKDEELLFSETCGRFVVTVDPKHKEQFEKLMKNLPCAQIGNVISKHDWDGSAVHNLGNGNQLLDMDVLRDKWKEPLGFGKDNYTREVL